MLERNNAFESLSNMIVVSVCLQESMTRSAQFVCVCAHRYHKRFFLIQCALSYYVKIARELGTLRLTQFETRFQSGISGSAIQSYLRFFKMGAS